MKNIVICCILLLSLGGCQKKIQYQKSVYMELYKGGTTYPTLATIIHNTFDEELHSGNEHEYILEIYKDGKWETLKRKNSAYDDILYVYKAKQSKRMFFPLKEDYGELKEGEYRITKELFNKNNEGVKVGSEFYLNIHTDASVSEEVYQTYEKLQSMFKGTNQGEKEYPDNYGGSYINDDGKLVVYLKDITKKSEYSYNLKTDVIFKKCKYSYNELRDIQNKIGDFMNQNPQHQLSQNIWGWGIYDDMNKVKVDVKKLSLEFVDEFKKTIDSSDTIVFEEGEQPRKFVKSK